MKTTATILMAIFLTMGLVTAAVAADDNATGRRISNQQMLLDELEPYNDTVTTSRVSAKRVDNLYMLLDELEPYGKETRKRNTSVKEKSRMTPKQYNNLCMVCDEIE